MTELTPAEKRAMRALGDAARRLRRAQLRAARKRDATYQAEKLESFVRRGGDAALWWRSKNFTARERARILAALAALGGRR